MRKRICILFMVFLSIHALCQEKAPAEVKTGRECYLMDFGWRFALGHPYEAEKDYNHGTGYFSFFAKTGYGDGPAAANFDDRAWRVLNLPHDWAVELPFDGRGSHSHGYKAIGRAFPQYSIGWYRKKFFIPKSDLGRRIVIEFDGIHRNSMLWINGFYIGEEHSGYSSFQYDITDYLNYGEDNVISVRVDATMEEGWYYEGAGIYRHVRITKTNPLHVTRCGTFVTSEIKSGSATITANVTICNDKRQMADFDIAQTVLDASGNPVATAEIKSSILKAAEKNEFCFLMNVKNPNLWSLKKPYLYKLHTAVRTTEGIIDTYETTFGIRSVRFDANQGFFLNGERVQLKGTNNHQDHAGVGTAIPDALQEYRIKQLKSMGCNAYRCSHNPPTPELLDACDRLGMLVLDENRLMGSSPEHLQQLERLIRRDRNHPCIIAWSLGNEEWAIEGNVKGERIAATMQAFAQSLDSTRGITVASSGGWGNGVSAVIDVMGFNYLIHGSIDEHHEKFPDQSGMGTEETTGAGTRGIYIDDRSNGRMIQMDRLSDRASIEHGIKYYDARKFLAGLFFWTGFDYRGEPNPLAWPAVSSQFGILDLCGFPKDIFYYLQSVWQNEPVLHLFPHWNWQGKEQQNISVWVYSNCDEVELFLNGKSYGKKFVEKLSHLEWDVPYTPGTLMAQGYNEDKEVLIEKVETTGEPAVIKLIPDRKAIKADGEDVAIITVSVEDRQGHIVPTANNELSLTISGRGKIIGVGNGDPASHEADRFFEMIKTVKIENLKELAINDLKTRPETAAKIDDSNWKPAFKTQSKDWRVYTDSLIIVRGTFLLPEFSNTTEINLFTKSIVEDQTIYVNGHLIAKDVKRNDPNQSYRLNHAILKEGMNTYAVTGQRFRKKHQWDEPNTDPGLLQVVYPAEQWKRNLFNGMAQILVQSHCEPGEITLTATSPSLESAVLKIQTQKVVLRPSIPAN
jgi:beta-galactosidase